MTNLVVRGLGENADLVTAGLGVSDGSVFLSALVGSITMVGSLSAIFIDGGGGASRSTGGIGIDIDIGID
jgi:hypothetical protein